MTDTQGKGVRHANSTFQEQQISQGACSRGGKIRSAEEMRTSETAPDQGVARSRAS